MADNAIPQFNPAPQLDKNPLFKDADYQPILSNWFTSKPYGFRFTPRDSSKQAKVMYLPIGPSNLVITTHFATNISPSIYATVEEHSPVRYYDIQIEGTTGMGPKYTEPVEATSMPKSKLGRATFTVQQSLGGGFFGKTLTTATKVVQDTKSLLRQNSSPLTGLQLDQTGYIAFHNLYRFLLAYKKDAAGVGSTSPRTAKAPPLVFFNHKDNNEYSVVVKSFTLRRSKEDPMLYFYSITMRGYDLTELSTTPDSADDGNKLLSDLGLTGVKGSTFLGEAKTIATQAKSVFGSIANGISQLGR